MFRNDGIQTQLLIYQVVSVVAHLGSDRAGHCRAFLPTGNGDDSLFRNLLTEDNRLPDQYWSEPFWLKDRVVILWLCLRDIIDRPTIHEQPTALGPGTNATFLQALGKAMMESD